MINRHLVKLSLLVREGAQLVRCKEHQDRNEESWVLNLTEDLADWVTPDQPYNLSKLQFPHLKNAHMNFPHAISFVYQNSFIFQA